MKIFNFACFVILSSIFVYGQGTFNFESAVDNGSNVTETVTTVSLTATCSSNSVSLSSGWGYTGFTGDCIANDTEASSFTITFDKPVTISSLWAGDGGFPVASEDWIFTPTPNNGIVTETVSQSQSVNVIFNSNFVDITAITITKSGGGGTYFLFDNIIMDSYLPVELTSFSASAAGNSIQLLWQTATEISNYGFEIQRLKDINNWEVIGFVKGNGNSNSVKEYSYTDKYPAEGKLSYRLKQIDNDGQYEYSHVIETSFVNPGKFILQQNYPNPFNPETSMQYAIGGTQFVSLKIYDILGNEVAELVNEVKTAGVYNIKYNAAHLSSGVYFYKLTAGNFSETRSLVLLR